MRVARQAKARTTSTQTSQEQVPVERPSVPPGLTRLPGHAARRTSERREYARARLALSLSVSRIAGQAIARRAILRTKDISSSGAFFLYPRRIAPGTPLALEVSLLDGRPRHRAVRMCTEAHVVRAKAVGKPGWYGLAVAFDDIRYHRDESLLGRSKLQASLSGS